jgi:anti-sigma regulatory factor (Ser/Thr protein kinase)
VDKVEEKTVAIIWKAEDEAERVLRQRRAFRECLSSIAEPASDVDAAELIYGELVANTIRYANGTVEVRLELVDSKPPVLVVRDHGPGLRCHPWTPRRDPYAESGRGLGIVELLARDVAVHDADGGGTVIRAVLPVTPRERAA